MHTGEDRSLPVRVRPRAEAIARSAHGERLRSQSGNGPQRRGQAVVYRKAPRFGRHGAVLAKYWVIPFNSPPHYPQYNGGGERAQIEVQEGTGATKRCLSGMRPAATCGIRNRVEPVRTESPPARTG
jgi:hypothetical protein